MDWFLYDNGLRHERVKWTSQLQRDEGTFEQRSNRAKDLKKRFEKNSKVVQKQVWQDEVDFSLQGLTCDVPEKNLR